MHSPCRVFPFLSMLCKNYELADVSMLLTYTCFPPHPSHAHAPSQPHTALPPPLRDSSNCNCCSLQCHILNYVLCSRILLREKVNVIIRLEEYSYLIKSHLSPFRNNLHLLNIREIDGLLIHDVFCLCWNLVSSDGPHTRLIYTICPYNYFSS